MTSTVAGLLNMTIDPNLTGQSQALVEPFQDGVLGRVEFNVEAINDIAEKELFGMECIDELEFAASVTATFRLNFVYALIDGDMFVLDDLIENIGDIRQVEVDRTPGQEWFQLGPVVQINEGTGEDIP